MQPLHNPLLILHGCLQDFQSLRTTVMVILSISTYNHLLSFKENDLKNMLRWNVEWEANEGIHLKDIVWSSRNDLVCADSVNKNR